MFYHRRRDVTRRRSPGIPREGVSRLRTSNALRCTRQEKKKMAHISRGTDLFGKAWNIHSKETVGHLKTERPVLGILGFSFKENFVIHGYGEGR